jgi:hypothetical protein
VIANPVENLGKSRLVVDEFAGVGGGRSDGGDGVEVRREAIDRSRSTPRSTSSTILRVGCGACVVERSSHVTSERRPELSLIGMIDGPAGHPGESAATGPQRGGGARCNKPARPEPRRDRSFPKTTEREFGLLEKNQMANAEKVAKAGVTREGGWLYYIDKQGNIARSRMVRGGQKKKPGDKAEVVAKTGVTRDNNYIYFMDDNGDVARVPRSKGGTARSKKKTKKAAKKPAKKAAKKAPAKKAAKKAPAKKAAKKAPAKKKKK